MRSSENYSVQAKNVIEAIISEYTLLLQGIHREDITLKELKKIRLSINNRYRQISDIAEIKNDFSEKMFKIIVFNTDYNELILSELDKLSLTYSISGQFILIQKPNYNYNQLMTIVDDIEKTKNSILSKCSKAKLDPILRARTALENEFIDQVISRETSNNSQKIFDEKEKIIDQITKKKIEQVLGKSFFKKYLEEKI